MVNRLEFTLLGGVTFAVDGVRLEALPTRTEQALTIYLAYQRRAVPRDVLINLFYPESDADQGRRNLRTALTRIKSKIGDVLVAGRNEVRLRDDLELHFDTVRLEQGLAHSESALSVERLQSALDNYYGDFLAGFFLRNAPEFELWQVGTRERLRLIAVQGFERLIGLLVDSAEFQTALTYTNKLLTIEPLMEHIHRSKMLLLARVGQPAQALIHFKDAGRLFADELGIVLSQSTHDLRGRIENLDVPPPFVLPPLRGSFVGREREIAQLLALLQQPEQRLVTLFGPGGMGKTRLAEQVARNLNEQFSGRYLDGIFFVELAGADSAETLILQIATVLGITLGGREPQKQLLTALQSRELLLILDNFEQLMTDSAAIDLVTSLLQQAPNVKLLVTSREQLRLYEESVFEVDGLATPAVEETDVMQVASVELFMQRARRRSRNYDLGQGDVAAVGELCRLLDGGPLGVELAAGWAQTHSVTQILANIQQSFDFLATRLRNVPPRQRSLRAVFDYSWGLLTADEQSTLTLLSLFSGPFTLDAALAVSNTQQLVITALAEKALLQELGNGQYRLHPQVGGFSAEKRQTTQAAAAMPRFATHYANLLESCNAHIDYWPTFRKLVNQVGFELANVQQAWRWVLDRALHHEANQATWIATLEQMRQPLRAVYMPLNKSYDGYLLFQSAFDRMTRAGWATGSPEQQLLHAAMALFEADSSTMIGEYERSIMVVEPLLAFFESAEAYKDLFTAYNVLLDSYQHTNRTAEAEALAPRYEAVLKRLNRPFLFGFWDLQRATRAQIKGDYEEALALYQSALLNIEPTEHDRYLAVAYDYLGELYLIQKDLSLSIKHKEIALKHAIDGETQISEAIILSTLANVYHLTGKTEQAYSAVTRSIKLLHKLKFWGGLPQAQVTLGDLYLRDGLWSEAAETYSQALLRARQQHTHNRSMMIYTRLPWLFLHMDAVDDAVAVAAHIDAISEPGDHDLSEFWVMAQAPLAKMATGGAVSAEAFEAIIERFLA